MRNALVVFGLLLMAAQMAGGVGQPVAAPVIPFTAVDPAGKTPPAPIVVQFDPEKKTGFNLRELEALNPQAGYIKELNVLKAARFMQEGLRRMSGQEPPLVNDKDISHGIVLVLFSAAPPALQNDPEVQAALRNTGEDAYNANEAYFLRSEPKRLLIIANTAYGLVDAVADLMESVDYEVLGLGPQWVYVPDYTKKPLVFSIKHAGRPGFYIRRLYYPATYQLNTGNLEGMTLHDPEDESFTRTYDRWTVGIRMCGQSEPDFPGHALQAYDAAIVAHMRKAGCTEGFLVDKVTRGLTEDMPEKGEKDLWQLWISTDPAELPTSDFIYRSYGEKWLACNPAADMGYSIDLSVPWVRQLVLDDMKKLAVQSFAEHPDELVIMDTEPEDGGGYIDCGKRLKYPNWYPDYLKKEGLPFGQPYALHGWRGINHPKESWDPNTPADTVFGFKNWILHEMDKWIDSLPPAQRVTATGKSKKALLRNSGYSYAFHDIPPDFNLDQRVRVQIAGFAKNRGRGKWKGIIDSHEDTARAFKIMLPREPSGDYRIWGTDSFYANAITGVQPTWDQSPAAIQTDLHNTYDAGMKVVSFEIEHMPGRNGLGYYLMSKMLWNPNLTLPELEAIRTRWFHRAFGSAWQEMKSYYDFMLLKNYPRNMPSTWAKAIRFIDAAGKKLEGTDEVMAQQRVDSMKVFWYYYYLLDSKRPGEDEDEMQAQLDRVQEFAWKGQMAHTVNMFKALEGLCGTKNPAEAAGTEYARGPAHFTHEEVSERWQNVLDFWKPIPVDHFAEMTLANGKQGKDVDTNDLVMVKEFAGGPQESFFYDNSFYSPSTQFMTIARKAGDTIGFKFYWASIYGAGVEVNFGLERWDAQKMNWEKVLDKQATKARTKPVKIDWGEGSPFKGDYELLEVRVNAAKAGTYRFDLGPGGVASGVASLNFDVVTGKCAGQIFAPHTYASLPSTISQSGIYIYIPKGTKSVDMDVWDTYGGKKITFYSGLPAAGMTPGRTVNIESLGTHRVPLQEGEDGNIAYIGQNGFAPPVFYSIPGLWAKSPNALLVPRGIAQADGLTIVGE